MNANVIKSCKATCRGQDGFYNKSKILVDEKVSERKLSWEKPPNSSQPLLLPATLYCALLLLQSAPYPDLHTSSLLFYNSPPHQPIQNHNPWMLLYFISFLLIVSFFVLNMFVGVVVENFHKCRQHQEAEEARRREEKRLRRLEKKRRSKEIYLSGR